jgi:NTE family protein
MTLPLGASPAPPSSRLAATRLFAGVDPRVLASFDARERQVRLDGGDILCRQGDRADALWIVTRGRLQVIVETPAGDARLVDTIGRGALVGEMALLLDEPRTATIAAARDSELVRITKADFDRLLNDHPSIAHEVARLLGERLKRTTRPERRRGDRAAIAILPISAGIDGRACADRIVAGFGADAGDVCLVTPDLVDQLHPGAGDAPAGAPSDDALLQWMSDLEDRFRYVVYQNDPARPAWARRCLRGSDVMVIVADAGGDAAPAAIERELAQTKHHRTPLELVLLHPGSAGAFTNTARWLAGRSIARHHHVRVTEHDDYARIGRFVSGRAVGLVLSGGGARGLAHIGVIRALRELGVPIDAIGGSSMGAIVGGLCAAGLAPEAMIARLRREYVDRHDYDYTLPIVALSSAAGSVRRMKRLFGDGDIEDLPIGYFCMSTNLSRAESVVLDRGPLWRAVRTSASVPGLLPPIADRGDLLVDGGLLNNLPADVMRQHGAGVVVGVDVTPGVDLRTTDEGHPAMSGWTALWHRLFSPRAPFPSVVDILSRTALVGCIRDAERMRAECDLYLAPPVEPFAMNDFREIDRLVAAGYSATHEALAGRTDLAGLVKT